MDYLVADRAVPGGDPTLGAIPGPRGRCAFRVWAPAVERVDLLLAPPRDRVVRMERDAAGYHEAELPGVPAGTRYRFRLDGELERPDPASRFQPDGVHGASAVVDHRAHRWGDRSWRGLPLADYVLYEVHVGTFTREGTFAAIVPHLDGLRATGVSALELMPVAAFPGSRNWGYDGVFPFAVHESYGGPAGLKALAEACHARGMALVLDVVYNHLGPEGNYLGDFGPYFTERYRTPWGRALNFDGPESDEVRRYFVENALAWFRDYHVDALRLDAIHGISDLSASPFLAELAVAARALRRRVRRPCLLIAESDLNDSRVVRPPREGGYGHDAQWSDDFHHALHTLLTGEGDGYYEDFGDAGQLAKAFRAGYVYTGERSRHRRRRHGNATAGLPPERFVVCIQNHDQVGNRLGGERLAALAPFEAQKLAAAAVLLAPFVPLLFMGEEYGETAPFLYFVSHGDPALIEAVRRGRREEFAAFAWRGAIPDPQAVETFERSRPDRGLAASGRHRVLLELHRELLRLRREHEALGTSSRTLAAEAPAGAPAVLARFGGGGRETALLLHFGAAAARVPAPLPPGGWRALLDTADRRWEGPGEAPRELTAGGPGAAIPRPGLSALLLERAGGGE